MPPNRPTLSKTYLGFVDALPRLLQLERLICHFRLFDGPPDIHQLID